VEDDDDEALFFGRGPHGRDDSGLLDRELVKEQLPGNSTLHTESPLTTANPSHLLW
jgi:hypothetical protein